MQATHYPHYIDTAREKLYQDMCEAQRMIDACPSIANDLRTILADVPMTELDIRKAVNFAVSSADAKERRNEPLWQRTWRRQHALDELMENSELALTRAGWRISGQIANSQREEETWTS